MNARECLKETDRKYLECFCRRTRDGFFIRYTDPALPDMYCHNFLYLKKPVRAPLLRKTLEKLLEQARAGGNMFFRVELCDDPASQPEAFPSGGTVEHNGEYFLTPDRTAVEHWLYAPSCQIRPMTAQTDATLLADVELSLDQNIYGRDFCIRRAERRTRVYISNNHCRNYLVFIEGTPAGTCTLFEHNGIAKLGNLAVCPERQHQKVASTLLRTLALTALDDGCTAFCLNADEKAAPKKLYQALGFQKVSDNWAVVWNL